MRSYQVFASLPQDQAVALLRTVAERAPGVFAQAISVASAAMRARPVFLQRQPMEKRIEAVRRALCRVSSNVMAEELFAVYFLECRKELLVEWLDAIGLEHDQGTLKQDDPPAPAKAKLKEAVETFRKGESGAERELLLRAFAAQTAIDWPDLEALLEVQSAA
jgi:hypothetical protein